MSILQHEDTLHIFCKDNNVLGSFALPRAKPKARMTHLILGGCPPPDSGSIHDTLSTMHSILDCSSYAGPCGHVALYLSPDGPSLNASHFKHFEQNLYLMHIQGPSNSTPNRGFLKPLKSLHTLVLWSVQLPSGELGDLPPTLRQLDVWFAADDPNAARQLPMSSKLEELRTKRWSQREPEPLTRCDNLRLLILSEPAMNVLPEGWLANCSHLQRLDIQHAIYLTSLPAKLFLGMNALRHLNLSDILLVTLPDGVLDHSPNLESLRLDSIHLSNIPSGMFKVARGVRQLSLFDNGLRIDSLPALAHLKNLTELNLARNSIHGDVCLPDGFSPIQHSNGLRRLDLSNNGVTSICRDWRENMPYLHSIFMTDTLVTDIKFKDLQFKRNVPAGIDLTGAPLKALELTREQYKAAEGNLSGDVTLLLDKPVEIDCNCNMYWTRLALDLQLPILKKIGELRCNDGERLRNTPADSMWCERPRECAELPDGCECEARPDYHPEEDRTVVRANCSNANLTHVPPLPQNSTRLFRLLLPHNGITELRASDIHPNITELDLSDNPLQRVDEAAAQRLANISGMVRLARNRLNCSCAGMPLLRALRTRDAKLTDLGRTVCSDGRPLSVAFDIDCSSGLSLTTYLSITLTAVLVAVIAGTALLHSRERRFFARAVLHNLGWTWRFDTEEDDDREYDAFVIYAHEDIDRAKEVLARLEPRYTFCLHERDWIPGLLISEQLVASVNDSRRVIALISRHFLASSWAMAEFRQAYAVTMLEARPRLIVVLLDEPELLETDAQLNSYIATRTYLRWSDALFWDRLELVLPKPRTPRPRDPTLDSSRVPHLIPLRPLNGTSD